MNLRRAHLLLAVLLALPLSSQSIKSAKSEICIYTTQTIKGIDNPVLVPKDWIFGIAVPEPGAPNAQFTRIDAYISSGPPSIPHPTVRQVEPFSVVISKFISKHGDSPKASIPIHPVFTENRIPSEQITIDNYNYEIYGPITSKHYSQWIYQVIITTPSPGIAFEVYTSAPTDNEVIRQKLKLIVDSFRPRGK